MCKEVNYASYTSSLKNTRCGSGCTSQADDNVSQSVQGQVYCETECSSDGEETRGAGAGNTISTLMES